MTVSAGVDRMVQSASMSHTFFVAGRPKSKDRPRLGRRRKAFTPEATIMAEEAIAQAYRDSDGPLFEGPVHVTVMYSLQGQTVTVEEAPEEPTKLWQGDIDNLLKTTLDALQYEGCAYKNDSQVRRVLMHKVK